MSITDDTAHELLRQGKLEDSLTRLKADVQTEPANGKHRIFLFQLLSVFGRWESALKQLQIAGDLDPSALGMVQDYRDVIRCEEQRARVFSGKDSPTILGEPDQWVAWLIEALKLEVSGQHDQADALRSRALEQAPATSGTITLANDTTSEFAWIADADPRMGPMLEAILNEQYYWIPLNQIAQIDFESPSDLRDFVWTAAHFTLVNGTQAIGVIP
ncbi:MAG: type VI secretion system accessory protein TagJ, partial [Planctomycetota bacterium]